MAQSEEQSLASGIAIIGMSGRFPGASSCEEFWEKLVEGIDCISRFGPEELEYSVAAGGEGGERQRVVRARGILEQADLFDAAFFGIYPKEAEIMDPQHRLFLECAWEAIEGAGHAPERFEGLIGVFGGLSMNTYLLNNLVTDRKFAAEFAGNYQVARYHTMLGNDKDFMTTRVSYKLNLRGPSINVQSACSTSLVAICQACTSLLTYQCDMALAGGSSITFPQKRDYLHEEQGMVSGDGVCRTFDASANGTVFGHGVAVLLLKRLDDAIADGDPILAVIRGSAVNNDGSDKVGYAAPSVNAQADVVALAQAAADVSPETISYVEAHGTATPLGDPIEVAALTKAFQKGGATRKQYCALGTGKTHIGHLDVAAGATGVIKTVLQLQHEYIPALLHFKSPNPQIDFANSPFFPVAEGMDWKRGAGPRRAGVSAFGVGGTNAHVVMEEAPERLAGSASRPVQLLLLSAKTETALEEMSRNLAKHLETKQSTLLSDVAYTLQVGRQRFAHRRALCASTLHDAVVALRGGGAEADFSGKVAAHSASTTFIFPGQGAQYVNMGRELYEGEKLFREAVTQCAELLEERLQFDIRSVIYPDCDGQESASKAINETWVTQPSIFVIEYALARLWMGWGIRPSLLIGHSVGEYVAAVLAGVLTLEEAIGLIASRARLMQGLPGGSMLAVRKHVAELQEYLAGGVAVAAINGPSLTTLSGPTRELTAVKERLEREGIVTRLLPTSHAFHSSMMDPIIPDFQREASKLRYREPSIPWISSCTGQLISGDAMVDARYWARQLRETVHFGMAIETAFAQGAVSFLEVGPGQALAQLVRQSANKPRGLAVTTSLGTEDERKSGMGTMLKALGQLWVQGLEPDWREFYAQESRLRESLPTYPFERKSYWVCPPDGVTRVPLETGVAESPGLRTEQASEGVSAGQEDTLIGERPVNSESRTEATARLVERQIQLMAQQLDLIRKRR